MAKTYFRGIGLLIGMIFGAGIFALPYVFSRAGLFWGVLHFFLAFFILIFLHFWYAEISYYTQGKHRFTGYAEIFLGVKAKFLAFLSTLFSYYGSLLIYGILGGIFLANIFSSFSVLQMTMLFFAAASLLILGGIERVAVINFYLTVPLFGFVIYLLFVSLPSVNINNFLLNNKFLNADWFLPYGVWIFALGCTSVIPEVRDLFSRMPIKKFKRVIWISIVLSAISYFLFIVSVWGVSGALTTEDAFSGIVNILGRTSFIIGSLIGFLAVFTSYIAMAVDMREVFHYDYKIKPIWAWICSSFPPIALYFFGVHDFVKTIGIIGSVGMGIFGVFVILIRHSMHKKLLEGGHQKLIAPTNGEFVKRRYFLEAVVLFGILAGVFYEIWRVVF